MILDSLNEELKTALKAKDNERASLIRMLVSAVHNKEIEMHGSGKEVSDQDVQDVLKKELKKRKEAALAFSQGGREEQAKQEESEAAYIEALLPPQLSNEELEKIVDDTLAELGEVTQQDFGKAMKAVLAKTAGKADGGAVSAILKRKLGAS